MTASISISQYVRSVGDEPLPGYRLIAPLGKGGFGEVWKCLAPGGLKKAIKFVFDDDLENSSLEQEYEAFQCVKGIRHPFLLTLERVELIGAELIMVMELADKSLGNRYDECRAQGLPGIPRNELQAYMVDAAEALDVLSSEHGLQHLDVKPANLFLISGHAKVGDYGLVSKHLPAGVGDASLNRGLTPRYVAPEILDGHVDRRSDQYPLALVYQELLTGSFPYPGPNGRQYLLQHKLNEPDVSHLPANDRPAVVKALAKNPIDRFPSCLAFVKALIQGTVPNSQRTTALGFATVFRADPTPATGTRAFDSAALITPSTVQSGNLTLRSAGGLTLKSAGQSSPSGPAEEFARICPGYQFVEEVESGPRGRSARAIGPDGHAVRVLTLRLEGGIASELDRIVHRAGRHAEPLWQKIVAPQPRLVAFVAPASAIPLREWAKGRIKTSGRDLRPAAVAELLAPVAALLDLWNRDFHLPHQLVNSATILVDGECAGLTHYGLAELLRHSRSDSEWLHDEPYAAPEALAGKPGNKSDQFSLGLVVLEMLKAWTPAKRPRGERGSIDWNGLLAPVRACLRRALANDPAERHADCTAFLTALGNSTPKGVVLDDVQLLVSEARLRGLPSVSHGELDPNRFATALHKAALAESPQPDTGPVPFALPDGRLSIRFPVKWTPGLGELKTAAFKDQFGYRATPLATDTVLLKPRSSGLAYATSPVELLVRWPVLGEAAVAEVHVTGRWISGLQPHKYAPEVAQALDKFRKVVQNTEDRRKAVRVKSELPVVCYPVTDELAIGAAMGGQCRDVSITGFSAVLESEPTTGHLYAVFGTVPEIGGAALLAKIVRTKAEAHGGWHIAARFVHAG